MEDDRDSQDLLYRARYEALVTSHADLVSRFAPDGTLVFVSPSYCRVVGRREADLVGTTIYDLISAEQIPQVRARVASITFERPTVRGENDVLSADGTLLHIDWMNAGIFDAQRRLVEVQSVGRDITAQRLLERDLKESQRRLERIASHDQLTGLPNRYLLLDRLETALKVAERTCDTFAVVFIDLDGFKAVNDTFGHLRGDEVLQQVSGRLQACVRKADTVGRIGGDEFVVLLAGVDRPGAGEVCRKLREAIAAPFLLGDDRVSLTASIGLATYPDDGASAEHLLAVADRSMYGVKRAARPSSEA